MLLASPLLASAQALLPQRPPALKCEVGPAHTTLGGGDWLVYACDDDESIVLVTPKGNPAFPFYFSVWHERDTYQIYGEGSGDNGASAAADKDVRALDPTQIRALLSAAKAKAAGK